VGWDGRMTARVVDSMRGVTVRVTRWNDGSVYATGVIGVVGSDMQDAR
jgi:hypothetical protein